MPETLNTTDPVFAIAANDSLVHAGLAGRVAAHWWGNLPDPQTQPEVSFHASDGTDLTLVGPDGDTLASFTRDPQAPVPSADEQQLYADRIAVALAMAQAERDRERLDPDGDIAEDAPARVPMITGNLPDVVTALAVLDDGGSHDEPDPGGWLHNLMHRIFG